MRESKIEQELVNWTRQTEGRAYKLVSPGNNGMPDRLVIFPNQNPVFIELKTDHGRLSAAQKIQIRRLKDLGQDVRVIYGIDGLSQFFQDMGFTDISKAIDCKYEL